MMSENQLIHHLPVLISYEEQLLLNYDDYLEKTVWSPKKMENWPFSEPDDPDRKKEDDLQREDKADKNGEEDQDQGTFLM